LYFSILKIFLMFNPLGPNSTKISLIFILIFNAMGSTCINDIFKREYILNHEEPRGIPPTVGNGLMRDINPWRFYMNLQCPSYHFYLVSCGAS